MIELLYYQAYFSQIGISPFSSADNVIFKLS